MATKSAKKAMPKSAARAKHASAPAGARPAWPVGLDTLAKAQQEGVKVFESLLRQGQALERRTREAAVGTAVAARGAAAASAREVQQLAGGTWDKLEQVFEDRVARALAKLGIYTQNDVQRLAERVDALSEAVNRLLAAKDGAAKTPVARRTHATKASRRTSAKRPAK